MSFKEPFRFDETRIAASAVLVAAICGSHRTQGGIITFGSGLNAFDMEFVTIGSSGNPNDTTGSPVLAVIRLL